MSERAASPVTITEADQKLQAALAEAQGEFPAIPKDRTVRVETKTGGSYSFSYAPLDSILTAVRPVLAKHGLAIVQRLEAPAGVPMIRTELLHRDGGRIASSFPIGELPARPQDLGSLLTYLRRYAVAALLCVAAEDDQDAGSATIRGEDPRAVGAGGEAGSQFRPPDFQTPDPGAVDDLSEPQRKKIYALKAKLEKAGALTEDAWQQTMGARYGTEKISELTKGQASDLIERLENLEQLL